MIYNLLPTFMIPNFIRIFVKGWKQPLEAKDMWTLGDNLQATKLADRFQTYWEEQLKLRQQDLAAKKALAENEAADAPGSTDKDKDVVVEGVKSTSKDKNDKQKKKEASLEGIYLRRAIIKMFFWQIAPLGLIKLASDMCSVFSPLFVKFIIQYAVPGSTQPLAEG
jgi:hypothetical protein